MSTFAMLTMIEIKSYLRNYSAVFWTFAYPVALLIILSLIFGGNDNHTAAVEISDRANNSYSEQYVEALNERVAMIPGLTLQLTFVDEGAPLAEHTLRLAIPPYFGEQTSPSTIELLYKGTLDASMAALVSLVGEVTEVFNRAQTHSPQRFALDYSNAEFAPVRDNQYNAFLISGLTALTVVSTAMFGFTTVLVELREHGALKMFQVFPMNKGHFLGGFILSRTLILSVFCVLFFYMANLALGTNIHLSPQHVFGFVWLLILGIVAFLGVGLLLVSSIKKGTTAVAIINMINLPIIFLSDLFIPVAAMPELIRRIAELSPVYLFVNAMRRVTEQQFVLYDVVPATAVLLGVIALSLIISTKLFQWRAAQ